MSCNLKSVSQDATSTPLDYILNAIASISPSKLFAIILKFLGKILLKNCDSY